MSDRLLLALGNERWQTLDAAGAFATITDPKLVALESGWAVAWQDTTEVTLLGWVEPGGQVVQQGTVLDGAPLALEFTGTTLHVLVRTNDGALADVVFVVPTPGEVPSPFTRVGSMRLSATTIAAPAPDAVSASPKPRAPAVPAEILDAGHGDESIPVALWWTDAQTLQFVQLLEGGIGEIRTVTGRGEYSPSLVREALRLAASE